MHATISALWLPWLATAAFIVLGLRVGKSKGNYDFISGLMGLGVSIIGTLASWLIYFMVLRYGTT